MHNVPGSRPCGEKNEVSDTISLGLVTTRVLLLRMMIPELTKTRELLLTLLPENTLSRYGITTEKSGVGDYSIRVARM